MLIDTGTGGQLAPTAGKMMDNLTAAGLRPEEIGTILVSHFHPDHIFGLMAKDTNAPIFPQAEILVPEVEIGYWTDPATVAALPEGSRGLAERIAATLGTWDSVGRIAGDTEVAPGVRSLPAHGHTPGHTALVVGSGSDELIVAGDVANVPALFGVARGVRPRLLPDAVSSTTLAHLRTGRGHPSLDRSRGGALVPTGLRKRITRAFWCRVVV